MVGRLAGKVALVTGGASGLGAWSAKLMKREGAEVVVSDVRVDAGRALAKAIDATFVELDVTKEDQWHAAVDATVQSFGGFHVLVQSAGVGLTKTVEELELAEWRRVHDIDLDGTFLGCKIGVSEMKKHTATVGGSIINISSISGIVAGANLAAYNSAKAGVRLLSKSVALHCAKENYNIRCNSVHPTFIETPMLDDIFADVSPDDERRLRHKLARQVPLGRLGRPDEVAWPIVFLASDESSFITGSDIIIDGGLSAM